MLFGMCYTRKYVRKNGRSEGDEATRFGAISARFRPPRE